MKDGYVYFSFQPIYGTIGCKNEFNKIVMSYWNIRPIKNVGVHDIL